MLGETNTGLSPVPVYHVKTIHNSKNFFLMISSASVIIETQVSPGKLNNTRL